MSSNLKHLLLCGAFLVPFNVLAQTACPVGTAPGSATCGPNPGSQIVEQPRTPSGEWIKTWGGIATSPSGGGGVSSGRLSEKEAEDAALQNCRKSGLQGCKVEMTYKNQCVAAAYPSDGTAGGMISTSATIPEAVDRAKSKCEAAAKKECKIALSECSEPVFRKY